MGAKCRMSGMHFRGPSWDGGDYHANYSAFEQFALCAHHSRSTSALGPAVDVCFAATYFSTLVRDIGGDGESNAEVPGLQFDSGKFGVGLWGGGGWVEWAGEEVLLYIVHALNSLSFLFAPILGSSQH